MERRVMFRMKAGDRKRWRRYGNSLSKKGVIAADAIERVEMKRVEEKRFRVLKISETMRIGATA